nr:hypothetical protein [Tanacetum cinerariifolium]
MSTLPKREEVKSVPRIMTDPGVRSTKRSVSEHLAKDACGWKAKIPKQEYRGNQTSRKPVKTKQICSASAS